MAFCCADIDTLVHTYLDGELAAHDLEELEQHIATCSACRARVDEELQFRAELRRRLTPPRAPDLLRARVAAALDAEDRAAAVAQRRRGVAWILPGTASVAAAAALILVVVSPSNDEVPRPAAGVDPAPGRTTAARDPIDVAPQRRFQLPSFAAPGVRPRTASFGQGQGAAFTYEYERDHARHEFQLAIIPDARDLAARGQRIDLDGLEVFLGQMNGLNAITILGTDGGAWVFSSGSMSRDQLMDLVQRSEGGWLRHAPDPAP